MTRRKLTIVSMMVTVMMMMAGIALLARADFSAQAGLAAEGAATREVEVDPAALQLGNSDAGAMMAMISRALSLHD